MTRGAEPDLVGPYLADALGDPRWKVCTTERIPGGKSNLTFFVRSPAGEVVLRRPPLGHVLPTAHDMGREVRVLRALAGTDVPVPQVLLHETDDRLLGQPFYVMRKVDGHVAREGFPPGYADEPEQRRAIGEAVVDTLVAIHSVDWRAVGLGEHGRPDGFLERQLRRWLGQWEAAKAQELPALDALASALRERLPVSPPPALVHGDYRLDNTLLAPDEPGGIAAVLDWELSTIGDPLVDLGLMLVYHAEAADDPAHGSGLPVATVLPGYPSRADVIECYAVRSGRDLEALPWYVAFGAFKIAVVIAGVVMRAKAGAMGDETLAGAEERLPALVELGRQALAGRIVEPR